MNFQKLKALIKTFPPAPGVYLMKDKKDRVLYIGKAKNLKKRVASYVNNFQKLPDRIKRLMINVETIEFIKTNNEMEALILENNLIKRYQAFYNVALKDNKTYPYIKISREDYPGIYIVRKINRKEGVYFGPFSEVKKVRKAIDYLLKIYPVRVCRIKIGEKTIRPCIYYDIGRCAAPCAGKIDKKSYNEIVQRLIRFLQGRSQKKIKQLEKKMYEYSENLNFEKAAEIRDQIRGLEVLLTKQVVEKVSNKNFDVVGYWKANDEYYQFVVLMVRDGAVRLVRNEAIFNAIGEENEILLEFLQQYYLNAVDIPQKIFIPELEENFENIELLSKWLTQKTGETVIFSVPKGAREKKLLKLAQETAKLKADIGDKLIVIKQIFKLRKVPKRIEGYDISNYGREFAVGSMVVFKDGQREPDSYRRFRIKFTGGIDDYSMMQEVLMRRFSESGSLSDEPLPDLILIDGGIGHLNVAIKVMEEKGLDIDVISIAKKDEIIYSRNSTEGIHLDKSNPALLFLMYIRDEAHRYGLNYNIKLRDRLIHSRLREIKGLGDKRIKALLSKFPDIYEIKNYPVQKVSELTGIPETLIKKIISEL